MRFPRIFEKNVNVSTALSGVASTLLKLGTTSHRIFGSPNYCFEDYFWPIKLYSEKAKIKAEKKIIFMYEFSVIIYNLFYWLNWFLKVLLHSNKPMSGKLIVLMEDFLQILPKVIGCYWEDIVINKVKCSEF